SLATGEKPTGSITFVPTVLQSGPAATTAIVDGRYQFDRTNGPTEGPHHVIVTRRIDKETVLRFRREKAAPDTEPETEWTLPKPTILNKDGPYQSNFICPRSTFSSATDAQSHVP